MIDKDTLCGLMLKECDICVHLHGKIPEGTFDFRLSPGQRSTLELLRYLGYCGIAGIRVSAENSWEVWKEAVESTQELELLDVHSDRAVLVHPGDQQRLVAIWRRYAGSRSEDANSVHAVPQLIIATGRARSRPAAPRRR